MLLSFLIIRENINISSLIDKPCVLSFGCGPIRSNLVPKPEQPRKAFVHKLFFVTDGAPFSHFAAVDTNKMNTIPILAGATVPPSKKGARVVDGQPA